jgi:hypothetical protein
LDQSQKTYLEKNNSVDRPKESFPSRVTKKYVDT